MTHLDAIKINAKFEIEYLIEIEEYRIRFKGAPVFVEVPEHFLDQTLDYIKDLSFDEFKKFKIITIPIKE